MCCHRGRFHTDLGRDGLRLREVTVAIPLLIIALVTASGLVVLVVIGLAVESSRRSYVHRLVKRPDLVKFTRQLEQLPEPSSQDAHRGRKLTLTTAVFSEVLVTDYVQSLEIRRAVDGVLAVLKSAEGRQGDGSR